MLKDKKTRLIVICFAVACVLAGVIGAILYAWNGGTHRVSWEADHFTDKKTGVTYTMCNPLAIKPIAIEKDGNNLKKYASDGKTDFYEIRFQEPTEFLCDFDEATGSSYVYRADGQPELTLKEFDPISGPLYLEGKSPVLVLWLYADDEYLPEEMRGQNPTQDTALVKEMVSALLNREGVEIRQDDIVDSQIYHFRLFSQRFPGLYYDVALFETTDGSHYIEDMATRKKVLCPADVEVLVFG